MDILLPCLYAFLACIAFSIWYNVSLKRIPLTCLGGALGWMTYLLLDIPSDVVKYLIATVVISIYAEIMARICKVPVTLFLTTAVLPLVPGGGMYYTMEYCVQGEMQLFAETGLHTLALAGAIALGIMLVSSLVRMWKVMKAPKFFYTDKVQREDY